MLDQPRSRQLPQWVKELDCVSFGPFGKHRLLSDEAMSSVWGALMEHILCTLIPAAWFIVVVRNLLDTLSPKGEKER